MSVFLENNFLSLFYVVLLLYLPQRAVLYILVKKKISITEQSQYRNSIKYVNAVAHKHPHIKILECY